jgi:hypothetical protein
MARRRKSPGDRKAELVLLVVLVVAVVVLGVMLRQGPAPQPQRQPDDVAAAPEVWPDSVRVAVLNGALPGSGDIDGLARDVQQYLGSREELDFLFPREAGNARFRRYDETVVVSRLRDRSRALAVAALLDLDSSCVVWELPPDSVRPEVDVVVYLGSDIARRRAELVPYSTPGQ